MAKVKVRRVKPYSGYNSETPDKLLLDAGVIFKNFIVGVDTYKSAKAAGKCLGATQKGVEFSAVPQFRRMEIDGVHTRTKGDTLIDGWEAYIKAAFVEMTSQTLKNALAAADVKDSDIEGYEKITGRDTIRDEDYLGNITYVGNLLGEDKPIVIQVYNGFSESGLVITAEDKNNATVECQFYGYNDSSIYDDADNEIVPPFAIYRPKTETETETQTNSNNSSGGTE